MTISVKKVSGAKAIEAFTQLIKKDLNELEEHLVLTRTDIVKLSPDNPEYLGSSDLEQITPASHNTKTTSSDMQGFRQFLSGLAQNGEDLTIEIVSNKQLNEIIANESLQKIDNNVIIGENLNKDTAAALKDKINHMRKDNTVSPETQDLGRDRKAASKFNIK